MDKENKYIPIAYCPKCKKVVVLDIADMYKILVGDKKIEVHIAACSFCDTVLNLDKNLKINYISEKEANRMGWILEKVNG